jgi:hypothetical protein
MPFSKIFVCLPLFGSFGIEVLSWRLATNDRQYEKGKESDARLSRLH